MKRVLIVVYGLTVATIAAAQPVVGKTYAESKREQDNQKYNDKYNNDNRNQRNSNSGTGGGVDKKAAEELAEQFRINAGKGTSNNNGETFDQVLERERRAKQKEMDDWAAARAKERKQHTTREDAFNDNVSSFYKLGFTLSEAEHLADHLTPYNPTTSTHKYNYKSSYSDVDAAKDAVVAREVYLKQKDTMSLQTKLNYIFRFRYAGTTGAAELRQLAKQYPEYRDKLLLFELETLPFLFYWPSDAMDYVVTDRIKAERWAGIKRFWEIYDIDPKLAFSTLGRYRTTYTDPFNDWYILQDSFSREKKNNFKAIGILSGLHNNTQKQIWCYDLSQTENINFWLEKPLHYWKEMATVINATPADVIANYAWLKTNDLKKLKPGNFCGEMRMYPMLVTVMKNLAESGEPSCMNAYGLQLAFPPSKDVKRSSAERKEGYVWLKKAIEKGSTWAKINLLYCAHEKTKGLDDTEELKKQLTENLLNTTALEQSKVVYELINSSNTVFSDKPYFKELAHTLCEKLAAGGNTEAKKLLETHKW